MRRSENIAAIPAYGEKFAQVSDTATLAQSPAFAAIEAAEHGRHAAPWNTSGKYREGWLEEMYAAYGTTLYFFGEEGLEYFRRITLSTLPEETRTQILEARDDTRFAVAFDKEN